MKNQTISLGARLSGPQYTFLPVNVGQEITSLEREATPGFIETFVPGNGMTLIVSSKVCIPPLHLWYTHDNCLVISCVVSAKQGCVTSPRGETFTRQSRHCLVSGFGCAPALCTSDAPQTLSVIDLICSPDSLKTFINSSPSSAPALFEKFLSCNSDSPTLSFTMDLTFMQSLREIADHRQATPALRQLYLRAKIVDLIYQLARSIEADNNPSEKLGVRLRARDVTRLHQVSEIVQEHLASPLTLVELSRLTGLNPNKLSIGFKQVFGITVHQYRLDRRMSEAERLLKMGVYSVTDIAGMVGYREVASFSRMFRSHYGKSPREIK